MKFSRIGSDLKKVWYLVIIVGVLLQLLYLFGFNSLFPEVIEHVQGRASFIQSFDGKLLFTLFVLALGEELVFRGLVQQRLHWVVKPVPATLITSIIFALLHITTGSLLTVSLDVTTVFIDSVFFGVIYYKTNNIYASWFAHAMVNIVATYSLLNFLGNH